MSEKGKRYPRIVQLQRVELSGRVAVEFLPSGSWKFEEARAGGGTVEGISMVFGEDEVAALIALVRGIREDGGELPGPDPHEPAPPEPEHLTTGPFWDEDVGWRILCSCGWVYRTWDSEARARTLFEEHVRGGLPC